jgi:TPR repeat protein
MLAVLLSGCAGKPGAVDPSAVDQIQGELEALLRQPYIDPLVRYLERYRADPARADHLKLVRAERDKRCVVIANLYKAREATLANLKKLERGYRLACPSVVDDFTAKLAKQTVQAESPNTAIAAVESLKATSPSQKELQNCYLLFSIANYREAQDACSAPARGGDARAQYGMAVIARIRQHYPESVKWSEKAAAQGLPEAEQHLGLLYLEGKGVPKEAAQALKWFETAGGHGVAEASARAGLMHYRGEGVPQNDDKARKWFSIAAQAGDAQAQMFLGEIYEKGAGVARDGEAARQWFSKAAEQGLAQAQGRLGAIYATGHGVQQDNMEAYHWLSLAVAGGNDSARSLRDSVARAMTPEQLSTARERLNRTLERRP